MPGSPAGFFEGFDEGGDDLDPAVSLVGVDLEVASDADQGALPELRGGLQGSAEAGDREPLGLVPAAEGQPEGSDAVTDLGSLADPARPVFSRAFQPGTPWRPDFWARSPMILWWTAFTGTRGYPAPCASSPPLHPARDPLGEYSVETLDLGSRALGRCRRRMGAKTRPYK